MFLYWWELAKRKIRGEISIQETEGKFGGKMTEELRRIEAGVLLNLALSAFLFVLI